MNTMKNWWTNVREKHIPKYLRWNSLFFARVEYKMKMEKQQWNDFFSIVDSKTFKYLYRVVWAVMCEYACIWNISTLPLTDWWMLSRHAKVTFQTLFYSSPVFQFHYNKCNDLTKSLVRHTEFCLIYLSLSSSNHLVEKQVSSNLNKLLNKYQLFRHNANNTQNYWQIFRRKINFHNLSSAFMNFEWEFPENKSRKFHNKKPH